MTKGLLLINLGTPDDCTPSAVRRFLRAFLSDKRVITLPSVLRYMLLYSFILPIRSRKTTAAYKAIWTPKGSPLRHHSDQLRDKVQALLGKTVTVAIGMRYGSPSIEHAVNQLQDCDEITVLPLYPQYSSSATGTAIEKALQVFSSHPNIPTLKVIHEFYEHPAFIYALSEHIKPFLKPHDYVLFSYHGLPVQHLKAAGCNNACGDECPTDLKTRYHCYRAKCLYTTHQLANALGLPKAQYTSAFQSRVGRTEWVAPYLESMLTRLAGDGMKRLLVVCPSFVADCLETLEEIGIRAKAQWQQMGGETLTVVPCLNADPAWVKALVDIAT